MIDGVWIDGVWMAGALLAVPLEWHPLSNMATTAMVLRTCTGRVYRCVLALGQVRDALNLVYQQKDSNESH